MDLNSIHYNINDNDTPINNNDNEALLPSIELKENNQSNIKYPTNCELFYETGKNKKKYDYDLIKHINPQGFFEIMNSRIVEMISQTKMKFYLSFDNNPEVSNCYLYIFFICIFSFCASMMIGSIVLSEKKNDSIGVLINYFINMCIIFYCHVYYYLVCNK